MSFPAYRTLGIVTTTIPPLRAASADFTPRARISLAVARGTSHVARGKRHVARRTSHVASRTLHNRTPYVARDQAGRSRRNVTS